MRFAQYDEMVETFPSDRPDQSFRKTVLPRRAASDGFVTDAHSSHAACNHRAVDTIPITDQIAWSLVPRECLADLASNPLGSGICGDGNPDQARSDLCSHPKKIERHLRSSWHSARSEMQSRKAGFSTLSSTTTL